MLQLPANGKTVRVRAEAKGLTPWERIEIVQNGAVIAQAATVIEVEVPISSPSWLAARCVGPYDGEASMDWLGAQSVV